jgi:hypothetical protein
VHPELLETEVLQATTHRIGDFVGQIGVEIVPAWPQETVQQSPLVNIDVGYRDHRAATVVENPAGREQGIADIEEGLD